MRSECDEDDAFFFVDQLLANLPLYVSCCGGVSGELRDLRACDTHLLVGLMSKAAFFACKVHAVFGSARGAVCHVLPTAILRFAQCSMMIYREREEVLFLLGEVTMRSGMGTVTVYRAQVSVVREGRSKEIGVCA